MGDEELKVFGSPKEEVPPSAGEFTLVTLVLKVKAPVEMPDAMSERVSGVVANALEIAARTSMACHCWSFMGHQLRLEVER